MTIADILAASGMNLRQLSDRFGIPYRTVQNWAADGANHRDCPPYVLRMIAELLNITTR